MFFAFYLVPREVGSGKLGSLLGPVFSADSLSQGTDPRQACAEHGSIE